MAYDFTQEGFRKFSEDLIAAKGDQATVTSLLADMQDTFNDNIGALANTNKTNEDLTAENKRLKDANMELFLRIGTQREEINSQRHEEEKPMSTKDYMSKYFESLEAKK